MDYTVHISKAIHGDVVPLVHVMEAMARSRATGYGKLPVHGPTLENVRAGQLDLLLDAANSGALKVCNHDGKLMSVAELVTSDVSQLFDAVEGLPSLVFLHTHIKHLNDWAATNGDSFLVKDSGAESVEYPIEDAFGKVVEVGHRRGIVDWGTSTQDIERTLQPTAIAVPPVPVEPELAEPAMEGPQSVTTTAIAESFAGLRWNGEQWVKKLGNKPKWLDACLVLGGARGERMRQWNPVLIGAYLVRMGHVKVNSVRSKFQSQDVLKPWLDEWKTYEADNFMNC